MISSTWLVSKVYYFDIVDGLDPELKGIFKECAAYACCAERLAYRSCEFSGRGSVSLRLWNLRRDSAGGSTADARDRGIGLHGCFSRASIIFANQPKVFQAVLA